jgi:hypothetical protein
LKILPNLSGGRRCDAPRKYRVGTAATLALFLCRDIIRIQA